MKNKMRFLLPKLVGITIIAGIATLIIGTIFKLLLLGTVAVGIGTLVARKFTKKRQGEYIDYYNNLPMSFERNSQQNYAAQPSVPTSISENLAVIPIQ
ncbi:hypothetical protein ACK1KB_07690 [Chryseobacterium sp. TY3]